MFCSNCGKNISNDISFCTNCGNKIEKNIPPKATHPITPPPEITPVTTPPPMTTPPVAAPSPMTTPPVAAPSPMMTSPVAHSTMTIPPIAPTPIFTPPIEPVYTNIDSKKKNKLLLPLIIGGAVLVIAIGLLSILFIRRSINLRNSKELEDSKSRNVNTDVQNNIEIDEVIDDTSVDNDIDNGLGFGNDQSVDNSDENEVNEVQITFEPRYNYIELPNVLSIDSDMRFSYMDYALADDVFMYSYKFNDVNGNEADFYNACEEYSILLQELNGFIYEPEYSEQHYANTGQLAYYLTREDYDYGIAIIVSTEGLDYYAYISIFSNTVNIGDSELTTDFDMPNFSYFLADRESIYFTFDETVNLDNGLSFYVYDAIARYPGDGTMVIDVKLDISSYYSDYYFNNGDFLLLPGDGEGTILSDAVPIAVVNDENGQQVVMPFLLSASSYDSYTFSFPVPIETETFLLYATNVLVDDYTYPVYMMQVGGD